MVKLENRFNIIKSEHPEWGDYIILCTAVLNMGYSERSIIAAFATLVEDEGWGKDEKRELIEYLVEKTKKGGS